MKKKLVSIVFVRRITHLKEIKHGGFDNILSAIDLHESDHILVEMPLGKMDTYRISLSMESKKRSVQFSLRLSPLFLRYLILDPSIYILTLSYAAFISRGKFFVYSADLGMTIFFHLFQRVFPSIHLLRDSVWIL